MGMGAMVTATEAERDWSTLLPELLNRIARSLLEICDFIRFRAVCKTWRTSTPVSDLPTQFPWILKHHKSKLLFYSIPFDRVYTIPAPNSLHKKLFGPANGYLLARLYNRINEPLDSGTGCSNEKRKVTINDRLSLFNPLNNDEIYLPAKENGGSLNWIGPWQGNVGESVYYFGHNLVICKLTFCVPGDDRWHKIDIGDYHTRCKLIFKKMIFSAKESTGVIEVMDIGTGTLIYAIPAPPTYGRFIGPAHLVEVSGEILRVCECDLKQCSFDVHWLEFGNKHDPPCWIKVNNIGNHALFIDMHGGFSLRANQSAGIRANSIYFFKSVCTGKNWEYRCEVYMMDIATGGKAQISCLLREPHSWYVPNLRRFHDQ
jgi:Protein of unknown function (DUF295)